MLKSLWKLSGKKLEKCIIRIEIALKEIHNLAQGGTAVGSGINSGWTKAWEQIFKKIDENSDEQL